ncbi:MAG: ATPase, T2SS/T4P/T4SS family [Deltaproteobacteria bacterium]|nr:ATPase, T2SS/T4P/T4SS family [Deltaproteobacteria bacterium]
MADDETDADKGARRGGATVPGGWAAGVGLDPPGVPAVIGLTDGRTLTGLVSGFSPEATEFVVWIGASDPEVDAFARRLIVPAARVVFVGFLGRPAVDPATLAAAPEPLRVQVSRARHFDVVVTSSDEGEGRGIRAVPLDPDSPFRELYFYRDNVVRLERLAQLGSILLSMGVVSHENVERALVQQSALRQRSGTAPPAPPAPPVEPPALRLGEVMRGMDLITEAELARAVAAKFHLAFVDLDAVAVDPAAAAEVPREVIHRFGVLPTGFDERSLTLATREPMAQEHRNLLEFRIGRRVREVIAAPAQLARHVAAFLARPLAAEGKRATGDPPPPLHPPPPQEDFDQILRELGAMEGEDEEEAAGVEAPAVADNVIVRLVHRIFSDAYRRGASDIHIEPNGPEENTIVRFRIDGDCLVYQELPPASRRPLVARIKILAGLDIAERRKPQDGKIKLRLSGKPVELRVATLPTSQQDEDAVLRILASSKPLPLAQMGLSERNHREVARLLAKPYGLILCVGPTGSGKTTTLHSMLSAINTPDMKIWTAEDPVEITQAGLRQMQVNPRAGLTFAGAMRAFLRADPDVIMIGEMRDAETAGTAVEASLTGHLVLSTLHTNSAPETITRLLDMGIDPFSFADALAGVLAQRLARALCKQCREPFPAPPDARAEIVLALGEEALAARPELAPGGVLQLWRGRGCAACGDTGYKGRVALHELMVTDPSSKRLIARKAPVDELRDAALSAGMTTLLHDGIEKCLQGLTDIRQVLAVCTS